MPIAEFDAEAGRNARILIELAMAEDLGSSRPELRFADHRGESILEFGNSWAGVGDITSESTIPENARGAASFVARVPGVVSGLPVLKLIAQRFRSLSCELKVEDGAAVRPGTVIATQIPRMAWVMARV